MLLVEVKDALILPLTLSELILFQFGAWCGIIKCLYREIIAETKQMVDDTEIKTYNKIT